MSTPFEDDSRDCLALVNDDEQYSVWPVDLAVPRGWRVAHGPASTREIADYIDQTWTDMRPKSLRDAMAGHAGGSSA
ncbi:MbtH family protein [Actinokineospora xionganensis]|uniref:MbtH family NRPS accessory protein n=1 Tax=Actinokineospora xionganensis TaxID=2684470 RepID=A0ABR7L556_9PSEU|nr:MbtH family NRPS accessory protein [Actinokineospora xionganensis]MBC6447531.1 MbtH family NRPS accessory protein [Actinokineospora xionganensis]